MGESEIVLSDETEKQCRKILLDVNYDDFEKYLLSSKYFRFYTQYTTHISVHLAGDDIPSIEDGVAQTFNIHRQKSKPGEREFEDYFNPDQREVFEEPKTAVLIAPYDENQDESVDFIIWLANKFVSESG